MHIYIHVPFCARRCSYCDFAIAVRRAVPSAEFTRCIAAELELRRRQDPWQSAPPADTLYFGGGTPSRLATEQVASLVDLVRGGIGLAPDAEVTLEANPDDVTPARAQAWRAAGVSRVSLGVQSFDPAVLAWMHRTHTAAQVPDAVQALREAGLTNISLDLIFAVPAELGRNWAADLDAAFALAPRHVSLYGLTVEPGTPLARWRARGEARAAPDERYAAEYLEAARRFRAEGFEHYEISNAGQPGFRSRHNSAYWQRRPFLGLGPSAHSASGRTRAWNEREWEAYRRRLAAGDPTAGRETLDDGQRWLEDLYLGLRVREGAPASLLHDADVSRWEGEGWAVREGERVTLTLEGWLRLDALVASARGGAGIAL